jgi:hypothetical protein
MRTFALAAALAASISSVSAVLYGCYPASANTGTLAFSSSTMYAGPCSAQCGQLRMPVTILANGTDVSPCRHAQSAMGSETY